MEEMNTKHIGDLQINSAADAKRYAHIEEVTGYLDVRADFQAPVLATVGGYLYVSADFQAPVLATVGGYLDVRADFQAPVLATVGSLYVSADFQAPVLATVGGSLDVRADFQAPVLATVGGSDITMRPIWFGGLEYSVTIFDSTMRIGCQEHSLSDWAAFDNSQIAKMDGPKAMRFLAENKSKLLEFATANGRVIE
jgi:hypothetical protein